jgi:hypothetical protein
MRVPPPPPELLEWSGPTHLPVQSTSAALSPGYSGQAVTLRIYLSYAELKKSWRYTSTVPYAYIGRTGTALPFAIAASAVADILTSAVS